MKRKLARKLLLQVVASATLLILAARCEKSNSVAGPGIGSSSGTLTGSWSGTFASVGNALDCPAGSSAQATFTQNGSQLSGRLDAPGSPCGFANVRFTGTLQGTNLEGTVTGDRFTDARANGTYFRNTEGDESLTIRLTNGSGYVPGGDMILTTHLP